jgi:hypothetical protein
VAVVVVARDLQVAVVVVAAAGVPVVPVEAVAVVRGLRADPVGAPVEVAAAAPVVAQVAQEAQVVRDQAVRVCSRAARLFSSPATHQEARVLCRMIDQTCSLNVPTIRQISWMTRRAHQSDP